MRAHVNSESRSVCLCAKYAFLEGRWSSCASTLDACCITGLGTREVHCKGHKVTNSATLVDLDKLTKEEVKEMDKWKEGDVRTCTRIELAIGDSEMVHISSASTACQM